MIKAFIESKWIPAEEVRPGGLYTILTKGLELLEVVYSGKVNTQGKLMEDKCYFSKVCLCRPISVLTFLSPVKSFSLPDSREGKGNTFTKGNFCPAFMQIEGGQKSSFYICCFLIIFSSK